MTQDNNKQEIIEQAKNSAHYEKLVKEIRNAALLDAAPRLIAHLKSLHSAGIGEELTDNTVATILGIHKATFSRHKGGSTK